MGLLDIIPAVGTRALAAVLIACLAGLFVAVTVTAPMDAVTSSSDAAALEKLVPGDIAWMLVSTALVLIMTPGLAFFYGGMAKHYTMVSTIMQAFVPMAIVPVLWALIGFSLAFGDSVTSGLFGNPTTYGLMKNVGAAPNPDLAATIPLTVYFLFQLVFAVITPGIIVGSIADRANASALCIFTGIWHIILYCPLAHMVWHPSGLIRTYGVLDFAGGTVVHMSSGWAALVAAWYIGKPLDALEGGDHLFSIKEPANVPTVVLGTALLWFGWFGFNAGSAGAANFTAAQAFLTTNSATAVAMLVWILMDHIRGLKMRATGACVGAVIGLVAITPAAGFVTVGSSMLIGLIGAVVCALMQEVMERWGRRYIDDTLDVWAAHGVGGTCGMVLTSLFATTGVNTAGADGAFYGNGLLLGKTLLVLVIIVPWFCVFTYIALFVSDKIMGLRATDMEMLQGLDISKHGERASAGVPMEVYQASIHGGTSGLNANGNGTANGHANGGTVNAV